MTTPKNPLARRQRRWFRDIEYRQPDPGSRFADRLRAFQTGQPPLSKALKPPVQVSESAAKSHAGPDAYPVFRDGELAYHEDSVGETVEAIDGVVMRVVQEGQVTEAQAQEIMQELERFRALAKAAYESSARSDELAAESARLAAEASGLLIQKNIAADSAGTSDDEEPKPSKPPRPRQPSGDSLFGDLLPGPDQPEPLPPLVQAHIKAEESLTRARIAETLAVEARTHAQDAARQTHEMRQSLERLHRLVGDAALTAHGLPDDHRDDQANRLVGDAQSAYRDAYLAVKKAYTGVNARLNRSFWLERRAKEVLAEAQHQRTAVSEQATSDTTVRAVAPGEISQARSQERSAKPGRAPSTVATQAARFFRQQRPPGLEGVELAAKFDRIPESPAPKPAPDEKPGQLRPYQLDILKDLQGTNDTDSVLITAPTGAGKTVILSRYIADLRKQGKTVAVMAHTTELIDQASGWIERSTGEKPGLVQAGAADWSKPVTVISHGTVADEPGDKIPSEYRPDVLIIDEAHHAAAEGYQSIIKAVGARKLVGLTATPHRPDGKDLRDTFDHIICRVETEDLIRDGYLVPPTIVDVRLADAQGESKEITAAKNLPQLYAEGIAKARNNGRRKIIVFVSGGQGGRATEVVQVTAAALTQMGVNAGEVMGSTNENERVEAIARFKRSREGVLVNFGTLNEGFDAPSTDAIVLGRNVGSPGTLAQIVGRGMRRDPDNPRKADVLVLNYSSQSADDVRRLVYNQVQGPKGNTIACGAPLKGTIAERLRSPVSRAPTPAAITEARRGRTAPSGGKRRGNSPDAERRANPERTFVIAGA